jgi:RND family efflux transporter MFP subunit
LLHRRPAAGATHLRMNPVSKSQSVSVATEESVASVRTSRRSRLHLFAAGALGMILIFTLYLLKGRPHASLSRLPSVAVAKVDREGLEQTLTVSAELHPYEQVSLHAKVAGYLQSISVDVGDRVKEGQAIAQLDVPELKNDLERDTASFHASQEEKKRAEATYAEAHLACDRLIEVARDHPKLIAQQQVDEVQAKDRNAAGAVGAAQQHIEECTASLDKTRTMLGYTTITAPFDGTITRRYADPGALIQAGTSSNTQTTPLVDIAEDARLRLVFPVPESAVPQIKVGAPVHVLINSVGQPFDAVISRFTGKVDRATRTMATEADVENKDGRFKPGMYANATLLLEKRENVVVVPVEAISVGDKPSVLVIDPDHSVKNQPIKLGLQTPNRAEVLEGLKVGDLVVVGSRAGVEPGQKVVPKLIVATAGD